MARSTGPTQKTRDAVFGRDRACVVGGCGDYLQIHHRRPRAMGGTRREDTNGMANLILVCLEHHAWIESNRETALDRGLLLTQNQDPETVALIWQGEWVRLYNDGSVGDATPASEEDDEAVRDYLRDQEPDICGLCGLREPRRGFTACGVCA